MAETDFPPLPENETWLTGKQVCEMLQITYPTLWKWRKEGRVRFSNPNGVAGEPRQGQALRYPMSDIQRLMRGRIGVQGRPASAE